MRLQKFLAHAGVASRRKCEEYISSGRVSVNGEIITEMGFVVDPKKDKVYFDKKRIKSFEAYVYVALNKPVGIVSSAKDEKNRKTVVDLIESDKRLYPVGRLDIDSQGLIILTNDGELANVLMHPSSKIFKTYIATLHGTPNSIGLKKIREGKLKTISAQPARVKVLKSYENDSIVEISIHEGQNHQVKRMFKEIGNEVKKLKRISIGEVNLGNLEVGNYRYLSDDEIRYLKGLR